MVSKHDDAVDFDKLEKELTVALDQEQRYWTENDAKFRAWIKKLPHMMNSGEERRHLALL